MILADTKFEFGLLPGSESPTKRLLLIDEALTPDSSRYWSAADYNPGQSQASFDKQYLRDWLISNNLRDKEGVALPEEIISETQAKYEEVKERIMGGEVHGKKGYVADGQSIQTDQSADAIGEAGGVHGKKGLVADGQALQTDQAADAIASSSST